MKKTLLIIAAVAAVGLCLPTAGVIIPILFGIMIGMTIRCSKGAK